ncbi:NAD-dependent protein deacylase [Enterococcus sp. HY326]|uniref:NAD-dependent protein deacylase n=1 Tax=Enterococcus sp. HY326 TaxID=2971265 RepID=UPI00223FAC12|nr:NAD-dependent protein deacylase [Enterococcus sp. HY326]
MKTMTIKESIALMRQAENITFLTGAGVSTPSGIPDYRSLQGVYQGMTAPEYLLSHTALIQEPAKFYEFVQLLYHPDAKPNVIHQKMAAFEKRKPTRIVTQNIDGLHSKAGSQQLVEFHGSLYHCHCRKCRLPVSWQDYLISDVHENCGGQIRLEVVLYEEGFQEAVIENALQAVASADLIVIVGTTFQVHPFCDLINGKTQQKVLAINQTPLGHPLIDYFYQGAAEELFKQV